MFEDKQLKWDGTLFFTTFFYLIMEGQMSNIHVSCLKSVAGVKSFVNSVSYNHRTRRVVP